LIPVAFGDRWEPSIVPFQILCLAGVFKVLIEYSGSAIQALGKIWGQVGRQVIHTGLVVVFVAGFSPFGLPGAAFGFLLSKFVMYLLMQALLIEHTELKVGMLVESLLPGLLCGVAVGLVVVATRTLAVDFAPALSMWQRLIVETMAGALAYLAFIKFNRFRAVRRLVRDTADDLAPPFARVARLLA
jgi:PST family polysaccharide transporter